eukprot:5438386-Pyramimonas_sp.AAC.1
MRPPPPRSPRPRLIFWPKMPPAPRQMARARLGAAHVRPQAPKRASKPDAGIFTRDKWISRGRSSRGSPSGHAMSLDRGTLKLEP